MAEYQVNIAELQEICDYVINADYPYFEELREAFKLLRHTGCREMEIFEIERWSQVSGDEFTLTPQKGNNNRTIILGTDFTDFKAAILGQYPPFLGRTYSQLQNLFKRVCPYWPIYSGGKQITLYTFRYLFLHELKADGLTNQQIANIMGHVNVETVSNYLDAILSSEIEVPTGPPEILPGILDDFITIDGLKWSKKPIKWNDGGSAIVENPNPDFSPDKAGLYYGGNAMERLKNILPSNIKIPNTTDYNNLNAYILSLSGGYNNLFSTESGYFPNENGLDTFGLNFLPSGYFTTSGFNQLNQFCRFIAFRDPDSTQMGHNAYYHTGTSFLWEYKSKSLIFYSPCRLLKLD